MSVLSRCVVRRLSFGTLLLALPALLGFALYPQNGFLGYTWSKWGEPQAGTPATVYWSLMPVGTAGSSYCAPGCTHGTGTSSLTLPNFYDWTTHTFRSVQLDDPEIFALIENALRNWGASAGVTFIYLPNDSGVPINDPAAEPPATGQIRIGVFDMGNWEDDGASPAGAFAPPPNGFVPNSSQFAPGSGDLILNSNPGFAFQNPAGAEGSPLESYPQGGGLFLNDLEGLLLHELGHTLGLAHSADVEAVMCAYPAACTYFDPQTYVINRVPEPDDVAGLQTLYGLPLDTDGDDVPDAIDNCTLVGNDSQVDADGDGFGNRCDGDLNNGGGNVNFADLALFRAAFGSSNAAADLNASGGTVNFADLAVFRALFGHLPGPSAFVDPPAAAH